MQSQSIRKTFSFSKMLGALKLPKLNNIQRIKDWWQAKSPKQKWHSIEEFGRLICESIGIRTYTDMKNYWYTASSGVTAAIYFALNTYTIQYYFYRKEYDKIVECTFLVGAVIGHLIMYRKSIGPQRSKLRRLTSFCGAYFYNGDTESTQYKILRVKHIEKMLKSMLTNLPLMFASHAIVAVAPAYEFLFQNIRATPLAIHLPLLEKDSNLEFILNMFLQLIMATYATIGSLAVETATCMINHTVTVVPDLIAFNLHEFQEEWHANGMCCKSFARFRNAYIQMKDYERYIGDVKDVYGTKFFICPFLWSFSMSFSIIAQVLLHKIGGGGSGIGYYVQMLIVCHMGNNVKETNKGIATAFYNMDWFKLPVSLQKYILCGIHSIQNGEVLTMGPLGIIDLEKAADLTKTIYRFSMTLNTMFK